MLLEAGLIEECQSEWAAPIVVAKRRVGDEIVRRMCTDYRKLNEVLKNDCFPMPSVDQALKMLPFKRFYAKLDLKAGYWQILMSEEAK